jgi:hypothetical protein
MKIVYIAHRISGDVQGNLAKIRDIVRRINLEMPDVVPFVPYYADVVSLDDSNPAERARGIKNDIAIMSRGVIDELWVCSPISPGIRGEMDLANRLGLPVMFKTFL